MLLKFWQSGWVKFVLSCIIVYLMVGGMISGELTIFWFLIHTLCLSYLLMSQRSILSERWNEYIEEIRDELDDDDDDDEPGPNRWV